MQESVKRPCDSSRLLNALHNAAQVAAVLACLSVNETPPVFET
jgi:hypothetical protein